MVDTILSAIREAFGAGHTPSTMWVRSPKKFTATLKSIDPKDVKKDEKIEYFCGFPVVKNKSVPKGTLWLMDHKGECVCEINLDRARQ